MKMALFRTIELEYRARHITMFTFTATAKVRVKTASSRDRHVEKQSNKLPYRKLSQLDKEYVHGMKRNSKSAEDETWIAGME